MTIFSPMRLDRLQRSLKEGLEDATGTSAHWDYSRPSQGTLPATFVLLSMTSGPGPWVRKHRRGKTIQPIDEVDLMIGPFVDMSRVGVVLNGFDYHSDGDPAISVNVVRNDIMGQINDSSNIEPVTASAPMAGALRLTADFVGAIQTLSIYGPITVTSKTLNAGHVQVTEGTQTMLVNIQAFSKEREPRLGAWATIQQCLAAIQSEDIVEDMRANGVGIWTVADPIDLSAIAGAGWETRAGFDLMLAAKASWIRSIDTIETVTGTAAGETFTASAS